MGDSILLSSYSFSSLSSLLCFSSVHIVGSLTSKLPSMIQPVFSPFFNYHNPLLFHPRFVDVSLRIAPVAAHGLPNCWLTANWSERHRPGASRSSLPTWPPPIPWFRRWDGGMCLENFGSRCGKIGSFEQQAWGFKKQTLN